MTDIKDIPLLDEFKEWLSLSNITDKVVSNYGSYLKKINREFISRLKTGSNDTPFILLEKHFKSSTKGPNITFVEQLLSGIKSNINQHQRDLLKDKSPKLKEFRSEKNAFRSYHQFLLQHIQKMKPHRKSNKLAPTHQAIIQTLNGKAIMLDREDLIDIFTNRLNTQDRNTGDKTFFPIGLIGKILDQGKARNWAKEEAKKVIIHTHSETVPVTDISTLEIDTKTGEVYVCLSDKEDDRKRVYNPELNGTKKEMFLSQIQFSDLDHDPEIHDILQQHQGNLPGLDHLTKWIKQKQKELGYKSINSKNYDKICNELYADPKFNTTLTEDIKSKIQEEVEIVSSFHILQLTSAEWNRSDKKQAKKTSK